MKVEEGRELQLLANGGWDERIVGIQIDDLVRSHVVFARDLVLVYDTLLGPLSGGWLADFVAQRREARPLAVVVSHSDWDHCWGNQCFPEVVIIGSEGCANRMAGGVGQAELAKKGGEHSDYQQVKVVPPGLRVPGDFVLDGGDLTFQFVLTPGHRPDHLALYIPELRALLPGDAVETPFALLDEDDPAQNFSDMLKTLGALQALPCEWLLCNHAPPQRGNSLIRENLRYYQRLLELARDCDQLDELLVRFPFPGGSDFYRDEHSRIAAAALKAARTLPIVAAAPVSGGGGETPGQGADR